MTTPPKVPMVDSLKTGDTFPVSQDGERRRGAVEHIKAYLKMDPEPFRGPAGKDGTNGKDGLAGREGLAGTNGKDGAAGRDGAAGKDGANGLNGTNGKDGAAGKDGVAGKDGAAGSPKRIERYTGSVSGSTGVATVTWTKAFAAAPLGKIIDGWIGDQQITGRVTATTTTTATVTVKRSRGALLLTTGPYEAAPAGTVVEIEVVGD